jgi:DNA-binding transcriptional LysR family regulator
MKQGTRDRRQTEQPLVNDNGGSVETTLRAAGSDRIELVQTFVRIVQAGNLSQAAAQLGTTQPTVSRRLKALEALLKVRLLQRSTHGMKLTEDGERCFERAKTLVADWANFEEDLRGVRHEPEGTLRVRVPHAFGQELLIGPLADYVRRHDKVSVEWLLDDHMPDFVGSAIDCAIHVGEVQDPGTVAIRLGDVPRVVVAAPKLLAGIKGPRTPEDLERLPWLSMRTFYRTDIALTRDGTGESRRIAFQPRISTDSLYALRSATLLGLGVSVGSSWLFTEDLARGDLVHVLPQWHARPLPMYLVYPYASYYPAKLRSFVDEMRVEVPKALSARTVQAVVSAPA